MKAGARKDALSERKKIGPVRGRVNSWRIKKRLFDLEEWKRANTIMLYVSFGSEVRTKRIIKGAMKQGKKILVPKTNGKRMKAIVLKNLKNLEKNRLKVFEPKNGKEHPKHKIDLVVAPGVSFDLKGNRIGYGGGYYDRFLKGMRVQVIGLAYEKQVHKDLPCEPHDQKVKKIVTEKRVIECGG